MQYMCTGYMIQGARARTRRYTGVCGEGMTMDRYDASANVLGFVREKYITFGRIWVVGNHEIYYIQVRAASVS